MSNLARTLRASADDWDIVSAKKGATRQVAADVPEELGTTAPALRNAVTPATGSRPVLLVVGNEGDGLRKLVREACHRAVSVVGGGDGVDSLNVGVATGVLLSQLRSGLATPAQS